MATTTTQRRSLAKTATTLFYWLCIGAAITLALWNLQPYLRLSQWALATVFGVEDTGGWGLIQSRLIAMVGFLMGAILWAVLQMAESYPILLRHDRRVLRQAAMEADQADQLPIRKGDDPALVQIKIWYNSLPLSGIRMASRAALMAYGMDGVICVSQYPPVEGGIGRLFFVLITGQWGLINWANAGLIVALMFGFQAILKAVLWLGRQAYLHHRAYTNQ